PTVRRTGSSPGVDCCPATNWPGWIKKLGPCHPKELLRLRIVRSGMRLAAIASALAIVLCGAVFGAILLQKASIPVPASAPPQATPTGRAQTVADSTAESAAAPERRQLAQPSAASAEKR